MKFASVYLQRLLSVIKSNRIFYLTFTAIWLLGLYYQLNFSQFSLSIWVNSIHTPTLDTIMVWLTNAGDGIWVTIVGLVLIILRKQWWIVIIGCLSLPSIVTQLLKHQVFSEAHRPSVLMADVPNLYYVKDVVMNQFNSFPSGHTTAAFSLYTLIALMIPHKASGWIWVCVATLIALSRVYLLQHFWADIMAGSLVGMIICTLFFAAFQHNKTPDGIQK
jgi:membrane-associated phospholipid phosphatase